MKLGKNSKYFYSAKSEASFSKEYHVTITLPRDDKWRTLRLKSWRCKRSELFKKVRSELLKVSKRSKAG